MKKILLLALICLCAMAYGQVILTPQKGVEIANSEDITTTLTNALIDYEAEMDIVVKDDILIASSVGADGNLIDIKTVDFRYLDYKLWAENELSELTFPKVPEGSQLNWTFSFGANPPEAFEYGEIGKFPKIKLDGNLKTNEKFEESVYRYQQDQLMSSVVTLNGYTLSKDIEGLVDLDVYINADGKVNYIVPNYTTQDERLLKYTVVMLAKKEFVTGAKVGKSNATLIHKETFKLVNSEKSDSTRYQNGLKAFESQNYITAAFEWSLIDEEEFTFDSTQYYNMAAACFLSDYSRYKWQTEHYYHQAHKLDWEEHYIKDIKSTNDSTSPVSFSVVSRADESETINGDKVVSFMVVDKKPVFKGCESFETEDERFRCFNQGIMRSVVSNFHYPEDARLDGVQGKVYVFFVIEKNGEVSLVSIEKSIDPSLDIEALRLLCLLDDFRPAMVSGDPVRMSYTVPINFKLQ